MALSRPKKKAAFIDRDGVLNDLIDRGDTFKIGDQFIRWTAPFSREELRLKTDAKQALELIGQKGYKRILVTNQPDIAGGRISPKEFRLIMEPFHALPLDGIYICKHQPSDGCPCRKPAPGMLFSARDAHEIDLSRSYMIGDMETDVEAGIAAGTSTILMTDDLDTKTRARHLAPNILQAAILLPSE